MRYIKFDANNEIVEDRSITGLADVAELLVNATRQTWLEDIGHPTCPSDLMVWHRLGEFIGRCEKEALAVERRRCAEIAWKMQQEQFGGGTAIGNAIEGV